MLGKSKFRFSFLRFPCCSINVNVSASQHFLAFLCGLVIAYIRKRALLIFGNILHHLITVTGTSPVLILHMIAVKRIKSNLMLRRIFLRHSRCKRLASRHQHQQNPPDQRHYSLPHNPFTLIFHHLLSKTKYKNSLLTSWLFF